MIPLIGRGLAATALYAQRFLSGAFVNEAKTAHFASETGQIFVREK